MIKKLLLGSVFTGFLFFSLSAQNYVIDCESFKQFGTHQEGRVIKNENVFIRVAVNFLDTGIFSFSTNQANGVTFSWSDTITQTGVQLIKLTSTDTIASFGTFAYELQQGCSISIYAQPSSCGLMAKSHGVLNLDCEDDSSGMIRTNVNPETGTAPFTYVWSTGQVTSSNALYNLPAGSYAVTVYDADSCYYMANLSPNPGPGTSLQADTFHQVCRGDSITLTATSDVHKYYFKWYDEPLPSQYIERHNGLTSSITVAPDSTHTYYLQEVYNCDADPVKITVEVVEGVQNPTNTQNNLMLNDTVCPQTTVTLTADCGSGQVHWFASTNTSDQPDFIGSQVDVVITENVTYYAFCSNGVCQSDAFLTHTFVVEEVQDIPFAQIQLQECHGDLVTFDAAPVLGNGQITWHSQNDPTSAILSSGALLEVIASDYQVYYAFSQADNCGGYAGLELTVVGEVFQGEVSGQNEYEICPGEQLSISVNSPNDVIWYDNAQASGSPVGFSNTTIVSPTQTETYYAFPIADNNSSACIDVSAAYPVTVDVTSVPNTLTLAGQITLKACFGDDLQLNPHDTLGGQNHQFFWFNTLELENANSLATSNSFIASIEHDSVFYAFVPNNAQGCLEGSYYQVNVEYLNSPGIPAGNDAYQVCAGQALTMSASGNGLICWFATPDPIGAPMHIGSNFTVNPTENTTYYVFDEYGNGCASTTPLVVDVQVTPAPSLSSGTQNFFACQGEDVYLTVPSAMNETLHWFVAPNNSQAPVSTSNPFMLQNVNNSATYYAYAYNGACYSANSKTVDLQVNTSGSITGNTMYSICKGQQVTLSANATNGAQINWFTNSSGVGTPIHTGNNLTVSPNSTTTFYAFAANSTGCGSSSLPVTVLVNASIYLEQDTILKWVCHDDSLTLSINTPYDVDWYSTPYVSASSYLFSGNDYVVDPQPITNNDLETISYYGFISNGSCQSSTYIYYKVVHVKPLQTPLGEANYYLCPGESVTMQATSPTIGQVCWFDTYPPTGGALMIADTFTVSPPATKTYYAIDEVTIGCFSEPLVVNVHVDQIYCSGGGVPRIAGPILPVATTNIQILTPNNDGVDDVLNVGNETLTNYTLQVFALSGQLVKTIDQYYQGWDGRDEKGLIQPAGYYVYKLTTNEYSESKTILLIK